MFLSVPNNLLRSEHPENDISPALGGIVIFLSDEQFSNALAFIPPRLSGSSTKSNRWHEPLLYPNMVLGNSATKGGSRNLLIPEERLPFLQWP